MNRALPPERAGHAAPPEIAARRSVMEQALVSGNWVTDPPARTEEASRVPVLRWCTSEAPKARIIHFHGGGYRMGCPEMEGPYALALARTCTVEVVAPRYRLAPERPFPAALVDAWAVLQNTPNDLPIILSGGSAGGGIAAGLALLARDACRAISGVILHSPWLDLTVSAASYDANAATDPLFSREAAALASQLYLQGHDPHDLIASPLLARLGGLPPMLISVGTGEVLYDDATKFARSLDAAKVPVRLLAIDGMDHVAVTRAMSATGAPEVFAATTAFIAEVLA